MQTLVKTVHRTLEEYGMIVPGEGVLVGVSGGPDSVCLMHLLHRFSRGKAFRLGVAHFHHGLRFRTADRDAAFTVELAESLGWPVYVKRAAPGALPAGGASPEESARDARFAFFREVCRTHGYQKVALGHHAGDNAELFLMRLMTWSGPAGLSGIPPVRTDAGGMRIIRPLIRCTREEIVAYLTQHGMAFVEDATNFSMRFFRNRVRHRLLPELKSAFNPKIETTLNRLCTIIAAEDEWLRTLTEVLFQSAVTEKKNTAIVLSAEKMRVAPAAAQRRVLRRAIEEVKGNLRRITFDHVETLRCRLSEKADVRRIHLPGGIRVGLNAGRILIQKGAVARRKSPTTKKTSTGVSAIRFYHVIDGPGVYVLPEVRRILTVSEISAKAVGDIRRARSDTAFFDAAVLTFPLILRNWVAGDKFFPLGAPGRQKVKQFFIDHKVPKQERSVCPLLIARGHIAWIGGYRIAQWARVTASTQNVLRIQLSLALDENTR